MNNPINPDHYKGKKIDCIDALQEAFTPAEYDGFLKGNAMKYIWREGKKDATKRKEDIEKAIWYLQKLLDNLKKPDKLLP